MNNHDTIEELTAVRSLGGLDDRDVAHLEELMATHGPACQECRRLRDQYAEVAGRLALAVAPEEIPAGFEDALVRRAVRRRTGWAPRRIVAAVAAAVILVAVGVGGYLLAPRHAANPLAGANVSLLHGTGTGTVSLAVKPGASKSYVVAAGMPSPPPGHVYELWFFKGKTPVPAVTFRPRNGVAVVQVPEDASGASVAAITVERAPGVQRPTTQPIFTGPIRAS